MPRQRSLRRWKRKPWQATPQTLDPLAIRYNADFEIRAPVMLPSAIQHQTLQRLLSPCSQLTLEVVRQTDSTNAELLRRAPQELPHGTCLVAQEQTAGRGRQGRRWLSDPAGSLTFSLLWHFSRPAAQLGGLPLVVTLALLRAFTQLDVQGLSLKWPNDLLRHGRKVAGVLVELAPGRQEDARAIIGIGINVQLPESLLDQIPTPATDLCNEQGIPPEPHATLAKVLNLLPPMLQQFAQEGFTPFQQEWMAHAIHQHRTIHLILPDQRSIVGECAGLNAEGALLVRQAGQISTFHNGEISLRLAP